MFFLLKGAALSHERNTAENAFCQKNSPHNYSQTSLPNPPPVSKADYRKEKRLLQPGKNSAWSTPLLCRLTYLEPCLLCLAYTPQEVISSALLNPGLGTQQQGTTPIVQSPLKFFKLARTLLCPALPMETPISSLT